MKRTLALITGGFLLLLFASSAFAWEFSMTGEFEYRYRFFSRTGPKDLYGNLAFQDSATNNTNRAIGFAGPAWYGPGAGRPLADANSAAAGSILDNFITRGGFSLYGSDARITDMKMTLYPSIKVNSAIEIFLALNIGGFRNKYAMWSNDAAAIQGFNSFDQATVGFLNDTSGVPPFERYYMSQTSDAATNTASIISVDEFKFAFQSPMGFFSFGTKNFPLGTGATFARNTREESIYMAVPYGPFLLRAYLFPSEPPRYTDASGVVAGGAEGGTVSSSGQEFTPIAGWGTRADGELVSRRYFGLVVQYLAGEMELGLGAFNRKQHLPRGYVTSLTALPITVTNHNVNTLVGAIASDPRYTFDRESWLPIAWVKFNNGRFFFNAEGAMLLSETTIRDYNRFDANGVEFFTTQSPKAGSVASHVFVEGGFFCGPSKLSLMYGQASGRVLSPTFGLQNHSFGQAYAQRWGIMPINYQALEPYNVLMFNIYGGGNNIVNADGTGEMGDARAFAGRLDYAIAANVNFFGSFIYAKRLERQGYYAGMFGTRDPLLMAGTSGNRFATGAGTALDTATLWKGANGYSAFNPWINDDLIGWEADAGVTWQLLDGLTAEVKYAYWSVGPWFDMAYKACNGTRVGGNTGNNLMVGRDPIQAISMSMKVNF